MVRYLKRLKSSRLGRVQAFPMYGGLGMSACNMQEWLACKNGSAARRSARRPSPGGAPPLIVSAGRFYGTYAIFIVLTVAVITSGRA